MLNDDNYYETTFSGYIKNYCNKTNIVVIPNVYDII